LFLGASETIADVRLLGAETLHPGEEGWLQLELRQPVVAVRGDRYILRRPSPGETLGGGTVIDPQPQTRHKRFDVSVLQKLESLMQDSPADVLLQASLALGPAPAKDVIARSRLETQVAEPALQKLLATGQLVSLDDGPWTVGNVILAASQWSALRETVVTTLVVYHQTYPLRRGMPREELKSRLRVPPRLFNLILRRLTEEGRLTEGSKWASLPGHVVRFSPFQQVKVDRLMAQFAAAPFAPPSVKECQAEVGEDIFNVLLESGDLLVVSDEVAFRKSDYEKMMEEIRQAIQQKGQITLAETRDLLHTSRKYVQALLEHLDAIGVTVREGDFRRLKRIEKGHQE
jgi:selenocysteine-specific elongation factor